MQASAATIICANTRLARRLRLRHAQEQLRGGNRAWESPKILPWQGWLQRCRDALGDNYGTLLNDVQESMLWQQIIEGSAARDNLLQTASVATQAAAAWQSLRAYQAPIFPADMPLNEDAYAFKLWAEEFQAQCQRQGWTDHATLVDELSGASPAADIFGGELELVGFDRFTPQQQSLFEALRRGGVSIQEHRYEDRNKSVRVMPFTDIDAEIRAAAHWARRAIEANGELTVGIITPQLRNLRTRIRYSFEDVLAPAHLRYRDEAAPAPFSISLGQSLTEYPLVSMVFSLLSLSRAPLSLETLSVLLRTPFIRGYEREQCARALLDERLRSRKQPALHWNDLLYLIDSSGESGQPVPILAGMVRAARAVLEELPRRQSPEGWAHSFARLLEALGWPGERALDSAEYQLTRAWHKTLDGLVSLRLVRAQMSRSEALSWLQRIAEGTGFQPETAETPIQVLDPQGAAAMAFDRVWMLGLTEESWPPRPHPNPFIPVALQKQYGIPGADAGAELERSRTLQEALVRSTQHLVFSYARLDEDRPLLASPLLQEVGPVPEPEAKSTGKPQPGATAQDGGMDSVVIFNARRLETMEDTQAPPVRGRYGAGGAALFQDQSQCPLRAFARRRLASRGLDTADIGADAMQRGALLHELMQNVWSELRSQARLKALSEVELEAFIQAQTDALLQGYRTRYPLVYTPRFAALEAARLARLLRQWLALELERAPFTVAEVEVRTRSVVGEVEFSTRLDRVDVLEDGRHVIIDYKSGSASVNKWAGARPDEPQLPLYAVTYPEPVAALTFAMLRHRDKFGFEGLAADAGLLPDTAEFTSDKRARQVLAELQTLNGAEAPDWTSLFDYWRKVLEQLAQEFRAGVATVTPKPGACEWCDQQPLCRIHEVNQDHD